MTTSNQKWDRAPLGHDLTKGLRHGRAPDPLGKRALFSGAPVRSTPLALECSSCKRESPVRLRDLPRLALPFSVTLPRRYHSYLKCPGCGRRTWMRAHLRV